MISSELRIRVDDFPLTKPDEIWRHNTETFRLFDSVMKKWVKSYTLGVIPGKLSSSDFEFLRELKNVEIALHGIDHDERFQNEFRVFETEEQVSQKIRNAISRIELLTGQEVISYIPPHNVIDLKTYSALSKNGIKKVFGGPETDVSVSKLAKSFYDVQTLVSMPPRWYGRSDELIVRGAVEEIIKNPSASVLTLHWTWETNIGLDHLNRFLSLISGVDIASY